MNRSGATFTLADERPATRAALVINPRALRNLRHPTEREALHRGFERIGEVVETPDPAELYELFARWRREGVNLIGISGGDGSFHAAVQTICAVWEGATLPRLLPLHGGTLGVVARAVHARGPLESVRLLREDLARGDALTEVTLATLSVGDRIAFNVGLGLFCTISTRFIEGRSRGPAAVYALIARSIASALVGGQMAKDGFRPWRGTVDVDGVEVDPQTMYGMYASSVADMWALRGFRDIPVSGAQFRHMRVHVGVPETLARVPLFALGVPGAIPTGHAGGATRISLSSPYPFSFISDGELYPHHGRLDLTPGPAFQVVCPGGR